MSPARRRAASGGTPPGAAEDIALERALEGLFRLGANRRFEARQTARVGAIVSRAGYAVLRAVADHGTIGMKQLAEACSMDGAAASRQVMQLVNEGLLDRQTAPEDARAVELSLTTKGREVYLRIVEYRVAHLRNVVQDWPAADRAQLAVLLERLVDSLTSTPIPR